MKYELEHWPVDADGRVPFLFHFFGGVRESIDNKNDMVAQLKDWFETNGTKYEYTSPDVGDWSIYLKVPIKHAALFKLTFS